MGYWLGCIVAVLLAGCSSASISESGPGNRYAGGYRGELSEYDVIGIDAKQVISEQQIQTALVAAKNKLQLVAGQKVLLVQSGAAFPDPDMLSSLARYFEVAPFSGMPDTKEHFGGSEPSDNYSRRLRLAAAKAGISNLIVYWGVLDSSQKNHGSKAVSWVPIVGWSLPDETQEMRIRLKFALVDVASGNWEIFASTPFDSTQDSSIWNRDNQNQHQIEQLKQRAYLVAGEQLMQKFRTVAKTSEPN